MSDCKIENERGAIIKNWKTTLGGSIESLGQGVRDLSTMMALYGASTGDLKVANVWCVGIGTVICLIGKFFSNLFAADSSEVQRQLTDHAQQIAAVKGDTTQLTREVRGQ